MVEIFFSIYMNVWGLPKLNSSTLKKNEVILSYILVICNLGQYFVFSRNYNFKRIAMIALIIDRINIINWVFPNYIMYIVNTSLFFMEFAQEKWPSVPSLCRITRLWHARKEPLEVLVHSPQLYIASSQSHPWPPPSFSSAEGPSTYTMGRQTGRGHWETVVLDLLSHPRKREQSTSSTFTGKVLGLDGCADGLSQLWTTPWMDLTLRSKKLLLYKILYYVNNWAFTCPR